MDDAADHRDLWFLNTHVTIRVSARDGSDGISVLEHRTRQGSVATLDIGRARAGMDLRSSGRAEERGNEVALSAHVTRWCADNLFLADHRHGLIARNRP
uniref:hypothetical protein n=1 Tax=Microvirga yunnanensis TaxID=2953740 RepID=UPI0021C99214|nr:hypothetical protein [Microvirga sp. HBU65207]